MFSYLRIAAAVPHVSVGDVKKNLASVLEQYREASEKGADVAVFPELCLTGYTVGDLVFQETLLAAAASAVGECAAATEGQNTVLVVGAPIRCDGQLYDAAVVCANGTVCGVVPKTFISSDHETDEKRWFSSGAAVCGRLPLDAFGLSGDDVLFSARQIFRAGDYCFGVEISSDLLSPVAPGTFLALSGAELIVNLAAAPELTGKRARRRAAVLQQSASAVCAYVYVSAGCDESTTDLVFSGHAVAAENGTLLAENGKNVDGGYILLADCDLGCIRAERLSHKSFADAAALYGSSLVAAKTAIPGAVSTSDGSLYPLRKFPFVPLDKAERTERCLSIFEMQVAALTKRMSVTGWPKLVIGVSGGLDSTLALLVSVEAMRRLGRPVTDVHALTLPCFGTTSRTHDNAVALMQTLGVTSLEISIKEAAAAHCRDIGHPVDQFDTTFENVQARERTQVLMDYACRIGGFVVGTGDLSELSLGWCTFNADHMSMYGVNAGVPKSLIRWIIDTVADLDTYRPAAAILRDINETPISPELLPPDEQGEIAQETESIIGPYSLHDFFLYHVIRFGFAPAKILELASRAFAGDFDRETILCWMKVFYRRFFSQQFKRSCLPDGPKIGSVGLSPRGDWHMPSDASSRIWLDELEKLS